MRTLEERVRELEDIEAIRRLKMRYAELCDANYDADGLASLFTEDATWDGAELGLCKGLEAIRAFFARVSQRFTFALHYTLGHQIDIAPSANEAIGSWYILEPATVDGRAVWIASTHIDRYRKVDGRWLVSQQKSNRLFFTPYESGWAKERFIG